MDRRNRRRRRQWTLVVYPVIAGFVRLRFIGRHTPSARRVLPAAAAAVVVAFLHRRPILIDTSPRQVTYYIPCDINANNKIP